ncbi:MAG: class I SAM-dependent methyltransferase [Solirubrobacteraceae bacterium]
MSSTTQTGTGALEGRLWSVRADDWAAIQERQVAAAYEAALEALQVGPSTRLLDVGCGAGMFLRLAADRGADVQGLDASDGLLAHARSRVPGAAIIQGELEQLPYDDASFDVVTGFNSFQYAARPAVALAEARRVARRGGRVLLLNWAPAELCQAAGYLIALGALMPPPPPGAPGPFALSDVDALTALFGEAELDVVGVEDIECVWTYPEEATAIAGLMCSGPVVEVAEHAGRHAVHDATAAFLEPFRTDDGGYRISNVFRHVIGTPRS